MTYDNQDFQNTLGREISYALEEIVDFEDLSIHECQQVLFEKYGMNFDLNIIKVLNQEEINSLTKEYNDYFEVTGIDSTKLKSAFEKAIWHWT